MLNAFVPMLTRTILSSLFFMGIVAALTVACSSEPVSESADADITGRPGSTNPDAPGPPATNANGDAPAPTDCAITVATSEMPLATATADGEMVLTIEGQALSKTSWAEKGNEAVVLEVLAGGGKRLGHFVLHQGQDRFTYAMHAGAMKSGDALTVRVSDLSAPKAKKSACIAKVSLTAPPADMADGVAHAPIVKWPTQKSFNDLPVLLGWSRAGKSYQLTYTNEDGGTVALCGGGAQGMRSEIARWGRGLDMEGVWAYGGAGRFERCDGTVPPTANAPRMVSQHPILYYGDGHNRVFESRGGYGKDCGNDSDKAPNGELEGWNKNNPGNELDKDDAFTIVIRPVPVDMDAIGVNKISGRREGIVDTYAPWLYRLVDSELSRENKIDDKQTFAMSRYLFVDVYANDVGGSGDESCGPVSITPSITHVTGGFRLRAIAKNGTVSNGPQMTADYFGGSGVKRIAVPLAAGVKAADITKLTFDAYDGDGIYFVGIGDAFIPQPSNTNGATLEYINKGAIKSANVYVDDDKSSCVNGKNTKDGTLFTCVGSAFTLTL